MEVLSFTEASDITSPNPFTLICVETPQGATNLTALSWWAYLSFEPEMIGFAMQKTSYSGEMVRANERVVLAMPTAEIAEAALACGSVSGRDTDKVKEFGIEMQSLPGNNIKIPTDSCLAIECTLDQTVEVGDHYLYICTVDNLTGDVDKKALFAWRDGLRTV